MKVERRGAFKAQNSRLLPSPKESKSKWGETSRSDATFHSKCMGSVVNVRRGEMRHATGAWERERERHPHTHTHSLSPHNTGRYLSLELGSVWQEGERTRRNLREEKKKGEKMAVAARLVASSTDAAIVAMVALCKLPESLLSVVQAKAVCVILCLCVSLVFDCSRLLLSRV